MVVNLQPFNVSSQLQKLSAQLVQYEFETFLKSKKIVKSRK